MAAVPHQNVDTRYYNKVYESLNHIEAAYPAQEIHESKHNKHEDAQAAEGLDQVGELFYLAGDDVFLDLWVSDA